MAPSVVAWLLHPALSLHDPVRQVQRGLPVEPSRASSLRQSFRSRAVSPDQAAAGNGAAESHAVILW